MLVEELKEGILLTAANDFKIWTSGGGFLRFIRWTQGKIQHASMMYLGKSSIRKTTHEVLYEGNVCYVNSMDFKYLDILQKKYKKNVERGFLFENSA